MIETDALHVAEATFALLERLDRMTTEEFALGGEKDEREALRQALVTAGYIRITAVSQDGDDTPIP